MTWLLVALGATVGAPARFVVDVVVGRWTGGHWPWGTLTVNVVGSAALGFVTGAGLGERAWALLAVGVCGSFTTASTFAWEALGLLRRDRVGHAAAYVGGTVVLTLGAFVMGRALGT